jgi:hypothetical protein
VRERSPTSRRATRLPRIGLFDSLKRPIYKSGFQRPWDTEAIVQILDIEPRGGDMAVLDVLYFTGEESVWQPPRRRTIRTIIPEGVRPRIGQRLVVGEGGGGTGNNTPPPVYWDRPEPDLPPMQFPKVPGGDDPKVMLSFLQGMVAQGTLDREGLNRARDYLEAGGWPG